MKNFSKRIIAIILAILMCFSVYIPISAEESFSEEFSSEEESENEIIIIPGDVDFNNRITAYDARLTLRIAAQLATVSEEQMNAADFDDDNSVTSADARCILRLSAGFDPYKEPETVTKVPETTTKNPETTTKTPETTTQPPVILTPENRKYTLNESPVFSTSYSKAAVLYDYDNDVILYSKNMHQRCHPASTTKVITACIASEYLSPDYILTVGNEFYLVNSNTSRAGIRVGQKIKFKEILKCLLLPSGCDAAYTIAAETARVASGNYNMSASSAIAYFVDMMNAYAKKLGMNDSHFANPDGFPHSQHYTSAYDMTKISVKALSVDIIRKTASMPWATARFETGGSIKYTNTNETINPYSSRYYPYMIGIKTGHHSYAGYCLLTGAKKDIEHTGKTKTFIAVVYDCPSKYGRYSDLKGLYDNAFSYFWRQP